jgi:copper(I)-binding protein
MSATIARNLRRIALATAAALAPMTLATGASAHNHGGEAPAGGLVVSQPYARATMPGAKVAAAYMQLRNTGKAPITLVSAASPVCDKVELHTMSMEGGIMRMRQITDGVAIQPGGTVSLAPGGMHLMLMGLRQQLTPGTEVAITLTFDGAPAQTLKFPVQAAGKTSGDHQH